MTTTESLQKAERALKNNDTRSAIRIIKNQPGYKKSPEAINILALSHALSADYELAEHNFIRAIKLGMNVDATYCNLGIAQLQQGKIDQSIKSFRQSLALNPNHLDSLKNLSNIYLLKKDFNQAAKYAEKAVKIQPYDTFSLNTLASARANQGDYEDGIRLLKQSLAHNPTQPDIYCQIANIYLLLKQYDAAQATLEEGLKINQNNSTILLGLAYFHESRNYIEKALSITNKALSIDAHNTQAIALKGRLLTALKEFDTAEDHLNKAITEYGQVPALVSELCNLLLLRKRYDDAYSLTEYFIRNSKDSHIPANIALSHNTACLNTGRTKEAKQVLKKVINVKGLPASTYEALLFAMGETLDRQSDFDLAFSYFLRANNQIQKPSDISYYVKVMDSIIHELDRNTLDGLIGYNNSTEQPIFIVGMPRSGTSLVEQILASHPSVYGGGELTELWRIGNEISGAMNLLNYCTNLKTTSREQFEKYSKQYLDYIQALSRYSDKVTDKLPHNFFHIGLIELLFPRAKIIHCKRHPFDTCLSIYFKKFNDNHVYAKNLKELAIFYRYYNKLMQHWHRTSKLEIHTVSYEKLVANHKDEVTKLISFTGLSWDERVLKHHETERVVMTPSCHQARQPIYNTSVYRWRNYYNYIAPISEILGDPEKYQP